MEAMKQIVPWVITKLKGVLQLVEYPYKSSPVGINTDSQSMAAYQAPWVAHECKAAIGKTGFYQAVANIMWIDFRVKPDHCDEPSMKMVTELADTFFGPSAVVRQAPRDRLLFP
eukprot:5058715-Lingulodinium_polyedra.AAC.1